MPPTKTQRITHLWKPITVCMLLLTVVGGLGIYMYAQRQYTVIRESDSRNYHTIMQKLHQELSDFAEQHHSSLSLLTFRSPVIQKYVESVFIQFPALMRLSVLDTEGTIVFGKEIPAVGEVFHMQDASSARQSTQIQAFFHHVQVPLISNQQPLGFIRGEFLPNESRTALEEIARITLQVILIATVLMIILGTVLIFSQITARISSKQRRLEEYAFSLEQANEHLRRTQKELQVSEKLASLGYLAAGVAHEIGNPLAATLGYVEILQKNTFELARQQDILQRTQKEIERIRHIIQELVHFSRPHSVHRQVLDVNASLRKFVAHGPASSEKQVTIHLQLTEFPLFADVDEQRLQSVFYNIVRNAVDAIAHVGDIRISTSRRIRESSTIIGGSEVIAIQFSDTGSGIPEEILPNVFDPFFTTKDPGRGMGLGLALCHRIIESFNGEIDVRSTPGKGTDVTVFLPPVRKPKPDIEPRPSETSLEDTLV